MLGFMGTLWSGAAVLIRLTSGSEEGLAGTLLSSDVFHLVFAPSEVPDMSNLDGINK